MALTVKTARYRFKLRYTIDMLSRDYWTVDNANLSKFTRSSYLLD